MGTEIERKFLVADRSIVDSVPGMPYRQGYLSEDLDRVVRVRREGQAARLTIKGRGSGVSRPEFEYEIPAAEADVLLETLCLRPLVEKTRHRIPAGDGLMWEIDVFGGENEGLVVAEIELPSEDAPVPRPAWLGREVTDDPRYLNVNLARNPSRHWVTDGPVR